MTRNRIKISKTIVVLTPAIEAVHNFSVTEFAQEQRQLFSTLKTE